MDQRLRAPPTTTQPGYPMSNTLLDDHRNSCEPQAVTGGAALDALFRPSSIAVIGAPATVGKAGNAMVRSLLGFPGRLHLINPRAGRIEGRAAVPSLAAIDGPVDLAVLVLRAENVPAALEEGGGAGGGAPAGCVR